MSKTKVNKKPLFPGQTKEKDLKSAIKKIKATMEEIHVNVLRGNNR